MGCCALTAALLGVWATQTSVAKSAAFHHHHAKDSSQSAGRHGSQSTSASHGPQSPPTADHDNAGTPNNAGLDERGGKQKNTAKSVTGPNGGGAKVPSNEATTGHDSGPVETRTRDGNAIDTRGIAPSRILNNNRAKAHEPKNAKKSVASHSFAPRHQSAAAAMHGIVRNAVGMPTVRPTEIKAEAGKADPLQSGTPATGVDRTGTPNSLAKFDASVGRHNIVQPITNPTLNAAALNRGAINGSTFIRPGFVPATVGGPTKVFAGISGNMIRPKY
jgi:hypothetical protein